MGPMNSIKFRNPISYIFLLFWNMQDTRVTVEDGNYKDGKKVFECPPYTGVICRPEELIKETLMEKEVGNSGSLGKIIVDRPCKSNVCLIICMLDRLIVH